jgi:hypothetical protein
MVTTHIDHDMLFEKYNQNLDKTWNKEENLTLIEGHGTLKPNIWTCMKHSNRRGPLMFCLLKMDK